MALPRYTRITRNGVEYLDGSDRAMYTITELSRAAMLDVGKFIITEARKKYYSLLDRITGKAARSIQYWVPTTNKKGKKVKVAYLYVGFKAQNPKTGKGFPGFYSFFQEQGTDDQEALHILFNTVNDNIEEIRKIEAQYLSAINTADGGESLIDESEAEGED